MIEVNGTPVRQFNFSGGEVQIRIENIEDLKRHSRIHIWAAIRSSDDLMALLLTHNALMACRVPWSISLEMPYLPYARQDRVCWPGEAFSLLVLARLINSMNFFSVDVWDPHSPVANNLIDNLLIRRQCDLFIDYRLDTLVHTENLLLVAPDRGATDKVMDLAARINRLAPDVAYCNKVRDPQDGKISRISVPDSVRDRDGIVVDDICDGGRTFIELASEWVRQGGRKLDLYVTHGIFSQGLDPLRPWFRNVYCAHTFLPVEQQDHEFLIILGE